MLVSGRFETRGSSYLCVVNDTKTYMKIHIISRIALSDIVNESLGKKLEYPIIHSVSELTKDNFDKYLVESLYTSKDTSTVKGYGRIRDSLTVINLIKSSRTYAFNPKNLYLNTSEVVNGSVVKEVVGSDSSMEISYVTENNLLKKLDVNDLTRNARVELLYQLPSLKFNRYIQYEEIDLENNDNVKNIATYGLNMNRIREKFDLSWYENPNNVEEKYKDYKDVCNKKEFEVMFRMFLLDVLEADKKNKVINVAVDSETTGTHICCLSPNNPHKDKIVSTPFAWRDKDAYVIYNDMYYFDNVNPVYMARRFENIFKKCDIVNTFYYDEEDNKVEVSFKRSTVNLIGHNCLFDGKVLLDCGMKPYWNDDTMLMSFNLNPEGAKKYVYKKVINPVTGKEEVETLNFGHSLKGLTHRCLGIMTLELSDFLGKGNEDKYGRIPDREVARLYGCADADFTRQIFKYLRGLMSDKMYKTYRAQDMPTLNKLYEADYYGLRVNSENVKKLAKDAEANREILKNSFFSLVEAYNKFHLKKVKSEIDSATNRDVEDEEFSLHDCLLEAIEDYKKFESTEKLTPAYQVNALYNIMRYPIYARTSKGGPSSGKLAVKKLLMKKNTSGKKLFRDDIIGVDGSVLISAEDLNKLKYPAALILKEYKELEKQYTSYYKPFLTKNLEGLMFYGFNMGRIATRRIMSAGQTMNDSMKREVIPYSDDYYMVDFDMAQVEYRIMVSVAGQENMVQRLKNSEKDFHTESASALTGIPAHLIEHSFRNNMKAVHFGIPYGLGVYRMTESMFGEIIPELVYKTSELKSKFESANKKVIDYLNEKRREALRPRAFTEEFKKFAGFYHYDDNGEIVYHDVGAVENILGFYRLFDLYNMDNKKKASYERAAGNFPIQGTASELLRIILNRFSDRLDREGLSDKVIWHMTIHDELLISVHKSISPWKLYEMLYEECIITEDTDDLFKGHTDYYIGIGVGHSWKSAKSDKAEAPVDYVKRKVKLVKEGKIGQEEWTENPEQIVMEDLQKYFRERVFEVVQEMFPEFPKKMVNVKEMLPRFENYKVRSWITDNDKFKPNRNIEYNKKVKKTFYKGTLIELTDEEVFQSYFETWLIEYLGEGTPFIDVYGNPQIATTKLRDVAVNNTDLADYLEKYKSNFNSEDIGFEDEDDDDEDDDIFSTGGWIDDEVIGDISEFMEEYADETTNDLEDIFEVGDSPSVQKSNGKLVTGVNIKIKNETEYKNFNNLFTRFRVSLKDERFVSDVESFLEKYKSSKELGVAVQVHINDRFKTIGYYKDVDRQALDDFLEGKVDGTLNYANSDISTDLTTEELIGEEIDLKYITFSKYKDDLRMILDLPDVSYKDKIVKELDGCQGSGVSINIKNEFGLYSKIFNLDKKCLSKEFLLALNKILEELEEDFYLQDKLKEMSENMDKNNSNLDCGVINEKPVMLLRIPSVIERKKLMKDLAGCDGSFVKVYIKSKYGTIKYLCSLKKGVICQEFLDALEDIVNGYNS